MRKELEELIQKAQEGDAMAQATLAEHCNICEDSEGAWFYANLSAERGCPEGLYVLGMCYLNGYGTQVNIEKAAELFNESYAKGCVRALTGLVGVQGLKGDYSSDLVLNMLLEAASANDKKALFLLAIRMKYGMDGVRDYGKYLDLLSASVRQEYLPAVYECACELTNPKSPVFNFTEGFKMMYYASTQGFQKAIDHATYLTMGNDKEYNNRALEILTSRVSKGRSSAMRFLGLCYLEGKGVKQDKAKAIELFERGAGAGDSACRNLAEKARRD